MNIKKFMRKRAFGVEDLEELKEHWDLLPAEEQKDLEEIFQFNDKLAATKGPVQYRGMHKYALAFLVGRGEMGQQKFKYMKGRSKRMFKRLLKKFGVKPDKKKKKGDRGIAEQ